MIEDAFIITIAPPPVSGIGNAGGFKMMLQDQNGAGSAALQCRPRRTLAAAGNRTPGLAGVFSPFNAGTPAVFADIDRVKAEKLGVSPDKVFEALQVYLGSAYINDFNYLGRTYEVCGAGRRTVPQHHRRHRPAQDAQRRTATWCRSARSRASAT